MEEFSGKRPSCKEARSWDMVSYLERLGFRPARVRYNDYWYRSPLRDEKVPSFKINRKLNVWYDHGLGKGGNLIDFAILYHNCSVGDWLTWVRENFSFQPPALHKVVRNSENPESKIKILYERDLRSPALLQYLSDRKILCSIAREFCKELTYELYGKQYFAIGFRNDSGGFELRNLFFKGSSSPKDFTLIRKGFDTITVFEGFFDFLSFLVFFSLRAQTRLTDYLILNSLSLFEKARTILESYENIRLYLDNDPAGDRLTDYALALSENYTDERKLYKPYKDLNRWLKEF
jgi:hypothetical protein